MINEYLGKVRALWLEPGVFFDQDFGPAAEKDAFRFAVVTGLLVALELGIAEALAGGSLSIIALVTGIMLLAMPFLVTVWIYLWTHFMRLCAYLLGENLPQEPVRLVVAYSVGGWLVAGLGFGLGKWLALAAFLFQLLGIEKILPCSRWTAAVYVGLPFSMMAVLAGFFTLMFKVFK